MLPTNQCLPCDPYGELVPPPTTDPLSGDLIAFCFNAEWLPYVIGALKTLTRDETYIQDDPDAVIFAVSAAENLIGQVTHECGAEVGIPWCVLFDFTTTDGGFVPIATGKGHWVPGTGWVCDYLITGSDHAAYIEIRKTWPVATTITHYKANFTQVGTYPASGSGIWATANSDGVNIIPCCPTPSGSPIEQDASGPWTFLNDLCFHAELDSTVGYTLTLTSIEVRGILTPIDIPNCS